MNPLSLILILLAAGFIAWTFWRTRPEILPEALQAALQSGPALLVDVREPAEWTTGTARNAVRLPLSDLRGSRNQWSPFLKENRERPLLLYCQSGMRSAQAAALLRREGYNARNAGSLTNVLGAGRSLERPHG